MAAKLVFGLGNSERQDHFREELRSIFGDDVGGNIRLVEFFEISEYGSPANRGRLAELFPGARFSDDR